MKSFGNLLAVSLLLVGAAGCGRSKEAPSAMTATEVPKAVDAAFADASADTKKAAAEIAADIPTNPGAAIQGFEQMSKRPDLTPAQREAMAQATMAAIAELQRAAAAGNAQAQEALEARAARK